MKVQLGSFVLASVFFAAHVCSAQEVDPKQLYDVSFQASPHIKTGGAGKLKVTITPKNGGELHDETPLSVSVTGPEAIAFSKSKYERADSKSTPAGTSIEAAFTGKSAGKGTVTADLTFVICNPQNCFRQSVKGTAQVAVQ